MEREGKNKIVSKIQKLLIIMILTMQMFVLFSPVVGIYAEEEETVEVGKSNSEDEDKLLGGIKREGNVFAENNAKTHKAFKEATGYDEMMHYLVTYNTLDSTLSAEDKASNYANLVKGNTGEALKGKGVQLKDKYELKNTSFDAVLGKDVDEGKSAGDTDANETNESLTDEEMDVLVTEIADDLTNVLLDEIGKYPLMMNINSKGDIETQENFLKFSIPQFNIEDDRVFIEFIKDLFSGSKETKGVGLVRPDTMKNKLATFKASEVDSKYRGYVNQGLKKYLSQGGISAITPGNNNQNGRVNGVVRVIKDAEDAFVSQIAQSSSIPMLNVGATDVHIMPTLKNKGLWEKQGSRDSWESMPSDISISGSITSTIKRELPRRLLIYTKGSEDDEGVKAAENFTRNQGLQVVKNRYLWNIENLPSKTGDFTKEDIYKSIKERYNTYVSMNGKVADYRKVINTEDGGLMDQAEKSAILGWTPLHIQADWDKGYPEALKEQLDKVEPEASLSGSGIIIDGERRPILAKDIFIDTENFSPVIIGGKNGKYKDPYTSGVSASVSKTAGNLQIKEDILSGGIWHKTNKKGNIKTLENQGKPEGFTEGQNLLAAYTSLADNGSSIFEEKLVGKDKTIGVDNYGNVILGDTGDVVIPYWQNSLFTDSGLSNSFFAYSPIVTSEGSNFSNDEVLKTSYAVKGLATDKEIADFIGKSSGELYNNAVKVRSSIKESNISFSEAQKSMTSGISGLSKENTHSALAVVIAASTKKDVKAWNKDMLEDAENGTEYYVNFSKMMYESAGDTDDQMLRWTAASLIQKAGWVRDYGMGDTIRLTLVSTMTRIYNETIADAGLEFIFYTHNITNSEGWENAILLIASGIGFIITMYLLVTGFKVYRGQVKWTKVITKVLILSAILLYPMVAYGNMVEYMINKPSGWILGNQMRLSVVLDTYFTRSGASRNVNEYYENMFGKYDDSDAMQLGNYNLKFYTTTDKAGFDINTTSSDDSQLNIMQRARLENYHKGIKEYPKKDLVYVDVPLMDMYKWIWDVRYSGRGVEDEEYGRGSPYPTYEKVVGEGDVKPLFEWLASGGGTHFKVEGYEPEIASYREYRVIPGVVKPLENIDVDVTEGLTTYGAGFREHASNNNITERLIEDEDIEATIGADILTGSELMYNIIMNSSAEEVDENLGYLAELSKLESSPEQKDANYYVPTGDDIRALVRDLSNTNAGRRMWYGETKLWSNFTRSILSGEQGSGGSFIDETGNERRVGEDMRLLTPPSEDFLGLTSVVNKYTPEQGEYNPYDRERLEEQVSRINANLLNNYMSTYAITRESLGDVAKDNEDLDHAEKMVMATGAYFQFNKSLGFNHFPTEYGVDSIKFDKYLALLYIPFNQYGQETMQFFDGEKVVPMTTAEYVAMSNGLLGYFVFAIAVILLIVFGLTYLGILYFGLLVFSMINFIKYYIIKDDYKNKSVFGSLMIMTMLSLCKNVVMLVIWTGSWLMNRTIAINDTGLPTYNPVLFHSTAIIIVTAVALWKVILPTWRGVMNDKENMGGQFFSDKAQELKAKITPSGLLPGGGTGVRGGSAASKFGSGTSSPDRGVRSSARRLGNKTANGLSKMKKGVSGITGAGALMAGGLMLSGSHRDKSKQKKGLSKMINSVNQAARGKADDLRGIDGVNRKKVDHKKLKASGEVKRKHLRSMGSAMNGLTHTVSGLSEAAVGAAKVGTELAGFKNDAVTTMTLGSAQAAAIVMQGLQNKGIKAKQLGNDVVFDSSGYDLEDESVRGELFNNSVVGLQNMTEGRKAGIVRRKIHSADASNYSYVKGDESIDLNFDNKRGMHEETFSDLMRTEEFSNVFIQPSREDLIVNRKGHVEGVKKGALKLRNPGSDAADIQMGMNKLYQAEQNIRQDKGLDLRKEKERSGLSIQGINPDYFKEELAPVVEDVKGMNIQGSRVAYNPSNVLHMKALKDIKGKVDQHNDEVDEKYGDSSANLMQYVVKDGDNQGVLTETKRGNKGKATAAALYGTNAYLKDVKKYKVNEEQLREVEGNVGVTKKLNKLVKGNKKDVVKEFVGVKDGMRKIMSAETDGMIGKDHETFASEVTHYLGATGVRNKEGFKTVQSNIEEIKSRKDKQEITDKQYYDLIKRENKNLVDIMDGTGKLDGFVLGRYNSNNPYIKDFEKKAKNKSESEGKEYKTLKERYDESVGKLEEDIERKKLMEMPMGVVRATTSSSQEEFNIDKNGVLTHKKSAGSRRSSLDGKDKEAVRSYLMGEDMEVDPMRKVTLNSK